MAFQITSLTIVYSTSIQVQINENIKAPRHWPLWGEFTGHRRIPRTKGQYDSNAKTFPFVDAIMIWPRLNSLAMGDAAVIL